MNCALYFGSFNPLHTGHIAIAKYVLQNCNVDLLRFVLTPENPFKAGSGILENEKTRLERLKSAINRFNEEYGGQYAEVSTVEFELPRPNYTYNTLEYMRRNEPQTRFSIIMGADNIANIERWYKWREILSEYEVLVYPRRGFDAQALCRKYNTTLLNAPLCDISSTMIREMAARGENTDNLTF